AARSARTRIGVGIGAAPTGRRIFECRVGRTASNQRAVSRPSAALGTAARGLLPGRICRSSIPRAVSAHAGSARRFRLDHYARDRVLLVGYRAGAAGIPVDGSETSTFPGAVLAGEGRSAP